MGGAAPDQGNSTGSSAAALTRLLCLAVLLWPVVLLADDLQDRIDEATRLNKSAPWQESQRLLDDLLQKLDQATPRQRDQIIFLQARNLALAGNYPEAASLAANLHQRGVDADLRLRGFRLSANIAMQRDRFEEAYIYLSEGLGLITQVDDPEPKVNFLSLMTYFYAVAGEGDKATRFGRQAVEIAQSANDPRAVCIALHDLSLAQEMDGRLGDAVQTRRSALAACEQAGDVVHIAASHTALGDVLAKSGDLEQGIALIRKGITGFEQAGYRDGVLNARVDLAAALVENGQLDEADSVLEPLIEELQQLEFWRNLAESHRLVARVAEARGEYKRALDQHRAAESAGDKLLSHERAVRIAFLQVELDTQAKEQEIALLRERNQVLQLQEQSQRQRRYLAFGGASAMALILVLLLLLLIRSRSDRRDLLWLSQHDGLTRLRNHTTFFRRATEALEASGSSSQPFTLIVADIDYFKAVNDQYGHAVGDKALKEVGRLLQEVFGPLGIVGRIGGEEFAIALPGIRRQRGHELVAELNERLDHARQTGNIVNLTMSFGVAETRRGTPVEILRNLADEALYEAKRRGRNQVVDAADTTDPQPGLTSERAT